jgi:ABC-type transport system involved in multi-copper enzyme maturation permease subunit
MSPLRAVFSLSLAVLLKSRRTFVIGLLCFMPVLGSALGVLLITSNLSPASLTGFGMTSFIIVNGYVYVFLVVVTLFYGTALISDEIDDKTITYLFMRPVPKPTIYLGKYLAYLVVGFLLLIPSAVLTFLIAMTADPVGELGRHIPILLQDMGVLAYGSLYSLIGTVFSRPVFVGLGFAFIWETIVSFIPGYLGKMTIKHYLLALLPHPAGQRGVVSFFESATSAPVAILVLLGITVAFVALGSWLFTKREYVLEQ